MTFKKVRMGTGMISRLEIKDESGAKLEEWTNMLEDFPKVSKIIVKKYGLEDLVEGRVKKKDQDLDWGLN